MNGLLNLLEQDTRAVSPEEANTHRPAEPEKKPEKSISTPSQPTVQTEPEKQTTPTLSDEDYENLGEVNASMYAFCMEAPLQAFIGISGRLKRKKANKTISDPVKLKIETDRIEKNFALNKEVVPLSDDEYKHLKRACVALAKLKKETEPNSGLTIASALIGILVKRAEIFIDEF